MKTEFLSQREFARRVDRAPSYINRLVHDGRIPFVDGKIPWPEGQRAFESVGAPGYEAIRDRHEAKRNPESKPRNSRSIPHPVGSDGEMMTEAEVNFAYHRARAAEKSAAAQIKQLELRVRRDELIERSDVVIDAADTAAELRSLLLSVPASVAPSCEGKSAREIEAIIEAGIVRAMQALQNSVYRGGG